MNLILIIIPKVIIAIGVIPISTIMSIISTTIIIITIISIHTAIAKLSRPYNTCWTKNRRVSRTFWDLAAAS